MLQPAADHAYAVRLLRALNGLAIVFKYTGRFDDAEALYRRALAILEGSGGARVLRRRLAPPHLGGLAHARGDYAAAEGPARRSVAICERAVGADHVDTAADRAALAAILDGLGRAREAEQLLREALATFERELGRDSYEVAVTLGNLAAILQRRGDLDEAEAMHRRALGIRERLQGAQHPSSRCPSPIWPRRCSQPAAQARLSRCRAARSRWPRLHWSPTTRTSRPCGRILRLPRRRRASAGAS